MDNNGNNHRKLTDNTWKESHPAWSPDGKKIMFIEILLRINKEIFTINPDGTEKNNITKNEGHDYFASWSPDSKQIAFQSERDGNTEIYIMNSDGTDVRRLTIEPHSIDWNPLWSPTGDHIIFTSDRENGDNNIYMVDLKGRNLTKLINMPYNKSQPDLILK